jgi:hypothetical protein
VHHPEVQLFLRGVARSLGKTVEKAEPCTLEHLRAINLEATLRSRDPEAQTAALVASLAFWGCFRLGALIPKSADKIATVLRLGNLELTGTSLVCTVRVSKTIQFAERVHRVEVTAQPDPLLCPLRAFARWTSVLPRPASQTPLCALSTTPSALLSHSRFLVLINRFTRASVPLSGHSFRRGFVRLAFSRGVPIWQIMHHGDWKALAVVMSYAEDALIPNPLGGLPGL